MKVSVLITTYNLEQYIEHTLKTVLSQRLKAELEILIGDDGSEDNTWSILQEYQKKYPMLIQIFQMPRDLHEQYNRVERSANNRLHLLKMATGDYCTYLDGDDYYLSEEKLQKQLECLENKDNQDCVVCGHNLYLTYEDGTKVPLSRARKERKYTKQQYWKWMFLQANAMLFRNISKEHWPNGLTAKYFDDNNITYWLLQYGKLYYLPECMGAYRQVTGSSWNAIDRLQKASSNMIGYSVELELAPENRMISDIRHFPDYAYLYRHRKEINRESCAPFYETAEKNHLTEAMRVYQMNQGNASEKCRMWFRYVRSAIHYAIVKGQRALLKGIGQF